MVVLGFVALLLTLIAVKPWSDFAPKLGLLDAPDARKTHEGLVPPVGGLGIFTIVVPAALLPIGMPLTMIGSLLLGVLLLVAVGAIDDAKPVNAKLKFAIHFLAAGLIVWPGEAILYDMGDMFGLGNINFGWFAPIFSIACGVYMINALNMIDGMDGLAGGLTFIMTSWLLFLAYQAGYSEMADFLAILLGATAGFLAFNLRHPMRPRATVFLGDAGSMALGLCLTWAAIHLSQGQNSVIPPISYAFIVALPIWDAFGLLVMRLRAGRHPFTPDRGHFHHHFLEAGYTPAQATPIILSYAAFLGALGVALPMLQVPQLTLTIIWVAFWALHTILTCRPAGFVAFLKRNKPA